ncbi:MAG TPA: ATP synthase F1 subunit gamma [Candidatus Magasanikbacteria bacterium]|nr:ATP synthase F1 subunit gamma [Candidatus Magasanikbacteria bacterium]
MAVNAKIVRRRIKSIGNTKKITKAMELVSASKMRKAVRTALATRSYALLAREMLLKLSEMKVLTKHPLMQIRPVKKILLVIVSSNRGLCGGFNSNIFKKTIEQIKNVDLIAVQRSFGKKIISPAAKNKIEISAITIGKQSEKIAIKMGLKVVASFNNFSDTPNLLEVKPIIEIIKTDFEKKKFDKVAIIYTDYISAVLQKPTIRQVLPISPVDLEKMIKSLCEKEQNECDFSEQSVDFIFEPNPAWILEKMLPKLIEVQLFQALLESSASEHSARMMAMRNASEAAEEMIGDLVFALNQARQAGITREIAEISGGAAALE